MKFFRNALFSRIFALLAGITFLNMSFILAEFDALGMAKNVKIVQIIINSGIEEEKETSSPESETDSEIEFLLSLHNLEHGRLLFSVTSKKSYLHDQAGVHSGFLEHFSPPPEVRS